MRAVELSAPDDFDGWRNAARTLILDGIEPGAVTWSIAGDAADLFASASPITVGQRNSGAISVSKDFIETAKSAVCASEPQRFALLYTALWRMQREPGLARDRADPLINRIEALAKSVRRDIHKMRAFVRFRVVEGDADTPPRYVAWFEPEHHIVRVNARFFVDRFHTMAWSILTPQLSIHWDGETLTESSGARREDAPAGDAIEDVWKSYYRSIFNPARLKIAAMTREMPRKYWKNMPEAAMIPSLIAGAQARESGMIATADRKRTALGANRTAAWAALRDEALGCTRCHLHTCATQTVFGEGPIETRLMFVGEQPGDQEDLVGRPFVGPAGQVFDRALGEAGIDRAQVYVTNAVKHFKFVQRGKRRLHQSPVTNEIEACRWWVDEERLLIAPKITVALGATAARALFGRAMPIGKSRGRSLELADGSEAWITVHPSYLLRLPDESKADAYAGFVDDLRRIAAKGATG